MKHPESKKAAPKTTAPPRPAAGPGASDARLARGARRKRETRERLLRAAYELMAERGMAAVAINEITEAADVGFGSFYNHFESKEAIHDAVVDEVLGRFGEALSHIADKLEDPAEIMAASIRYVTRRASSEPLWGRLLVRTAFSLRNLQQGIGRYMMGDLQRGIDSGRFRTRDPLMTLIAAGGTAAAAISIEIERAAEPDRVRGFAAQIGLNMNDLAERTASSVLLLLGLPEQEADEIARRPLPEMELPPGII